MEVCTLKSCKGTLIILLIVALVIFAHFIIMKLSGENLSETDFMNKGVFVIEGKTWSWWPISHFILYFILGFFFPQCFLLLMVISIGFEIFETTMGNITRGLQEAPSQANPDVEYQDWWAGSFRDVVVNFLGFIVGAGIGYLFFKAFPSMKSFFGLN